MSHLQLTRTVIFLVAACSLQSAYAEDTPARIGAILPLTGEGVFWGENPERGIELAFRDLKEKEGIAPPQIFFEDDHCNPKDAVAAFHKLVDIEKVNIILGPACSSASAALVPLAEERHVLVLAFSESSAIKSGSYVFLLWVPNNRQGRRLAQYVFNRGIRSIGIFAIQNSFGLALAEAFKEEFTRLGGEIAGYEEYAQDSKSMRPELLSLKGKHPSGLLIASYIADGIIILREARELGINVPLFGPSTINSPEFLSATRETADGLVLADLLDSSTPAFKERWVSNFGGDYPGMQSGGPIFYDLATILGRWLQGHKAEATAFRDYLKTLNYTNGVTGGLRFTPEGYLDRNHSLFQLRDGKLHALNAGL